MSLPPIKFHNVGLKFPNFRGLPTRFDQSNLDNPDLTPKRTFSFVIPPRQRQQLLDLGFQPRFIDWAYLLQVRVKPANYPVHDYIGRMYNIRLELDGQGFMLNETNLNYLDETPDDLMLLAHTLIINPFKWTIGSNHGMIAYLEYMSLSRIEPPPF